LSGPVYGVAYDGTGFGTDGTSWGGELFRADCVSFERIATFRPIALPGGDVAIREPWRIALALLHDAFDGDPPLDRLPVDPTALRVVRRMLQARLHTPLARGVGRYFDGVGALALGKTHARFEGEVAMAVEHAADKTEHRAYHYEIDRTARPWTIDLRPMIRELIDDHGPAQIAAKVHNTIIRATADVLREARIHDGPLPVVLTGGCFQNALLSRGLLSELDGEMPIFLHQEVPPGDGGIALGQAVAADAMRGKGAV
jgi:hydrogenase maturation protein HypF